MRRGEHVRIACIRAQDAEDLPPGLDAHHECAPEPGSRTILFIEIETCVGVQRGLARCRNPSAEALAHGEGRIGPDCKRLRGFDLFSLVRL